nr:recombinase family protein [Mycobacterium sp. E3298]
MEVKILTDKIYVSAYCRVSTSSKDQENSYENQKSYFEREITKNEAYQLYDIYADKGITGTSLNKRDEFTRMLIDAGLEEIKVSKSRSIFSATNRTPKFKMIFVKNTSRFARNVMVIEVLRELLKQGVIVHFLDIDLLFDGPSKEFMLNLFLNFDQQDSIDKSNKVKFGHIEGAKKGHLFSNSRIYGYSYHKDEEQKFEIREEEAEVIREIYKLYNEGIGVRRIINHLTSKGIYTRNNKPFAVSAVKRILSNEKYYGASVRQKYTYGSMFNKSTFAKINDESKWIVHENAIPSIITKEEFVKAQMTRDNKINHKMQKGIYKGTSEFAGKIICSECGASYVRNKDRGKPFYNCTTKKNKGTAHCDNVNVYSDQIEMELDVLANGMLAELFLSVKEERLSKIDEIVKYLENKKSESDTEEIKLLKEEIKGLEEEKNRTALLYIKGNFDSDYLDQLSSELDEKIAEKRKHLKSVSQTENDIKKEIGLLVDLKSDIKGLEIEKKIERTKLLQHIDHMKISRNTNEKRKAVITFEFDVFNQITRIIDKYNMDAIHMVL